MPRLQIPSYQRRSNQRMERNTQSQSRRDSSNHPLLEVPQLRKEVQNSHQDMAEGKGKTAETQRCIVAPFVDWFLAVDIDAEGQTF